MLQGSKDLLVLSHVEQFDGVHRALLGGRSDAACQACIVLPRESRAEPVKLHEQPPGLSRLDCNGDFGKLKAQLGHDLQAARTPSARRPRAIISQTGWARCRSHPRSPRDSIRKRSTSICGRCSEPTLPFLGLLAWNSCGTEAAQPVANVREPNARKRLELATNRCDQLRPVAVWIA